MDRRTQGSHGVTFCAATLSAARRTHYHALVSDDSRTPWTRLLAPPELGEMETHVFRIALDRTENTDELLDVLSEDERVRVRRFYFAKHGVRYAVAHSALRRILAQYADTPADQLEFVTGEHGKPELVHARSRAGGELHFNLSHSGDMALVAVSLHGAVGVDVERWRDRIQHLEIAERFFSPFERDALRSLPIEPPVGKTLLRGFFSTWSRKEAYLKATGHGISRGLHHFDVTMARADDDHQAELLADRLDPAAVERWKMHNIGLTAGYSAALVTSRHPDSTPGAVRLFDSPYM